jgi:hypothetical protein
MTRPVFLVSAFLIAAVIAACEPVTPAPKNASATPTSQATSQPNNQPNGQTSGQPTSQPTVNARATEAVIISHIFATMTASAPTTDVAAATPTRRSTAAPTRAQAATNPTPSAGGPAAKATADPYLAQIPKGMGGILLANYIGNRDATFTISDKTYTVGANAKTLIVIAPGRYNFSLSVPGVPEAGRSETVQVEADRYTTYSITLPE